MKYLTLIFIVMLGISTVSVFANALQENPVKIIFDTDMGNDIDDALALAVIHELANRGEAELLAVTVCKDNPWAAVYVDVLNHFYGRPEIPIGVVNQGITPDDGNFIRVVAERKTNGDFVYPRQLGSGKNAPEAVSLIRQILAGQPDNSVVLISVGFLTNIARLLYSTPDDYSPLHGVELIRNKVKLYSMMAGDFCDQQRSEYNAGGDPESTGIVFKDWPTPIVVSGFEIGLAIRYPAESIENDYTYVKDHPVAEAYRAYMEMPYDRPTWDLTSVLYAVRPYRGYFGLSSKGTIVYEAESGRTVFTENSAGQHQFLTVTPDQIIRVKEALVWLASSPPRM